MTEILRDLKRKLTSVVERTPYKGLLFSGGLDTSILAHLNASAVGITVSLGSEAEDIPYAVSLAKHLNMKHFHRKIEIDEAIENIPSVIKILKSFDPALPNDLVVYFGLKSAKDLGLDSVATGDGSDELFGGYAFMRNIANLEDYIQKISQRMSFSSSDIGKFFNIKIIQPFINKEIIDFALQIPVDLKIRRYTPLPVPLLQRKRIKVRNKLWGKWVLRKAFEDVLPKEIIWQSKRPLEVGSGMMRIRKIISDKISDEELREKPTSIRFISKEHFYYYKVYKKVVGEIPKPKADEINCPGCGAGMEKGSFHCRICGYVLNGRGE